MCISGIAMNKISIIHSKICGVAGERVKNAVRRPALHQTARKKSVLNPAQKLKPTDLNTQMSDGD